MTDRTQDQRDDDRGDDDRVIQDFIEETAENLSQADQCLLDLERAPADIVPVQTLFRAVHTLKSSCGWLGFTQLEQLAHAAESLLAPIRSREQFLTPEVIEALLSTVDETRRHLQVIKEHGREPSEDGAPARLADRLRALAAGAAEGSSFETPETHTPNTPTPTPTPTAYAASANEAVGSPPPPARHPSLPGAPTGAGDGADLTVRVDVKLLDELMKLVGELVLTRNQLMQVTDHADSPTVGAAVQRLDLVTTELQDRIMLTRMQPLAHIWARFPRLVRDAAQACDKKVRLQMEGADTELDRTMVEAMRDPLTHLIRNAVDHGIETPEERSAVGKSPEAVVHLRAHHEEGRVHIEVEDDGRGIDVAAVRRKAVSAGLLSTAEASTLPDERICQLIFTAGLSTRDEVTALSGRGVGMDVVKTDVERVGGRVDIQSAAGKGTRVTMRLPLTLAILPSVLVECAGEVYAIPQINLLELVLLSGDAEAPEIREVGADSPVYSLRGELLTIVYLSEILELAAKPATGPNGVFVLVLQAGGRRFGLVVDSVLDTQEIVVKPLGRHFADTRTFSGATILGDGRLALILDVADIAQRGHIEADRSLPAATDPTPPDAGSPYDTQTSRVLLMSTRTGTRLALPLDKVQRLEEIPEDAVEVIGGREVVQYRGGILRLLHLDDLLDEQPRAVPGTQRRADADGTTEVGMHVVVHSDGGREIGLVVHRVLDILDESIDLHENRPRRGVLGSAVLAGRVTEVVDLAAAIAAVSLPATSEVLPQ